ncbi:MAG: serine hydrolase [Ignavibacteriales bacterium]|nr:serine hydrolase [Ignavibacteriales bacterium]
MKSPVSLRILALSSLSLFLSLHDVCAQIVVKDLDAFVQSVQKEFEVPGLALAIVKDGKVVVAKGYGVRKMGEAARVDEQTLFGIASNTKAFTATALGLLVEEGMLEWDAPVVKYLPWFQLSNPYVTREITIRDLLVHRSGLGLGAGDLLWWPRSTYDRKEIAKRLKFIPLVKSFRSAYAYDNVLYLIAGEVIEAISGLSWEDFVATRILAKLGMTDSNVRHSDAGGNGNVAMTHASVDGKVRPIEPFTSDNTNPAGGINASARDIAKWMIVQLDSGRVSGGTRLFSPQTTVQLWRMVTPIPAGNPPPELSALRTNFNGYALGFGVSDYHGYKFVHHTGGLPGYVSKIAMIPELKLGVAVLTNQESGEAFESITYHVLDEFIGGAKKDWLAAFKKMQARLASMTAMEEKMTVGKRDSTSRPSLPLASYAGTYSDPWYGDITVASENGKLMMRFGHTPSLEGELQHWQFDTFIARWKDRELRADAFVTFSLNPDGSIDQAKMRAVSPATDFSFDFQDLLLKPVKRSGK